MRGTETFTKHVLALVAALALALPASALAQGNPFGPLPSNPQPQDTPTIERPVDINDPDRGLSTLESVVIFGGAIGILGAIGYLILGDARRNVPSDRAAARRARSGPEPLPGEEPGKTPKSAKAKAKQRQKQKAARAARKRTKRGR